MKESNEVASFYFGHIDGSKMPDNFQPGQYLGLKIPKDVLGKEYEHDMVRNYSVSCAPGQGYLRSSIGRNISHADAESTYHGTVSNYMHDNVHEGDKVLVRIDTMHTHNHIFSLCHSNSMNTLSKHCSIYY